MFYPEDTKATENADASEDQNLLLDGTVNPDYSEDEPVPRIKGLIELLNGYLGNKSGQGR